MHRGTQGGYIGLIALLMTLAIVCLFVVKTYFSPPPPSNIQVDIGLPTGSTTVSQFEQANVELDAAKAAGDKLKDRNKETTSAILE